MPSVEPFDRSPPAVRRAWRCGPTARSNELESSGLPFGMMEDADYEEMEARFDEGDRLLLFSDGAVEVHNAQGELLGAGGLVRILQRAGYPARGFQITAIEEQLLLYSNDIRLTDDLTFIEVRFREAPGGADRKPESGIS